MNHISISEKVHELFKTKKTILFCGAGISYNSGLPVVKPLIQKLLRELGAEENDLNDYSNSGYPFEATIEDMNERVPVDGLLNLFAGRNPGLSHNYFAWLAKNDLLKLIITTNFDTNIEIALENYGLRQKIEYDVVTNLTELDFASYKNKVIILKLHGSVENMSSLITSIGRIARAENKTVIQNTLNNIFSNRLYENILFWGYSFSDHFDITPALKNIQRSHFNFFEIFHDYKQIKEEIISAPPSSLYRAFSNSLILKCNSDKVLDDINTHSKINLKAPLKIDWETKLKEWVSKAFTGRGLRNNYSILSHIFTLAGNMESGRFYAEKALKDLDPSDLFLEMDLQARIAGTYIRNPNERNIQKAIPLFKKAISIAKSIGEKLNESIYTGNLANCYSEIGRLDLAEKYFKETIALNKLFLIQKPGIEKVLRDVCGYQVNLAVCYRRQSRLDESEKLFNEILEIAEDNGFLAIKELCLSSKAKIYYLRHDLKTALPMYLQSYEIAKTLVLRDRLDSLFFIVCSQLKSVYNHDYAKKFYEEEIKFMQSATGVSKSFEEIPDLY